MRLLTPAGLAGVAIVRVEPGERSAVIDCLRTRQGDQAALPPGGAPTRVLLEVEGRTIDDVLALARPDGEVEIHLHGAPVVLDQLDRCFGLIVDDFRLPAERLLREALSVAQLDLAIEQLHANFDIGLAAAATLQPVERARALAAALQRSRLALALANAPRLVLVGRQNAGKSSLFNSLLFRERALTGPVPGLTRDPIAETTVLGGYPYELVDTAGEGQACSALDAAAIESGRIIRQHGLMVLVVDGSFGPATVDRELAKAADLIVRSKCDLPRASWPHDFVSDVDVSTVADDSARIRGRIGSLLSLHRGLPPPGPVGGFAALSSEQWLRLIAADDGCPPMPAPA